jgi:Domain of unknown function (DUF4760)
VGLLKPLGFSNVPPIVFSPHKEWQSCGRSSGTKIVLWAALAALAFAEPALAQGPAQPGLSLDSVKTAFDPLITIVASIIVCLAALWGYLVAHPPAAVLLSTVIASAVAIVSIRSQRITTRLRETFNTLNDDNWDEDVIKARRLFKQIREAVKEEPHEIAKFCDPNSTDEKELEKSQTLQTIMNDYENLALGLRLNIIDENFLYRWMRSVVIRDFATLSPLVTAYRGRFANPEVYIEFEGLALSWQQDRSYRSGRRMRRTKRTITIH